ncbi:MAG: AtpZ/AtpI family protein [Fusobacteriaceae bacterium]
MKDKKNNLLTNRDVMKSFSLLGYISLVLVGNILVYVYIYKMIEKYFFKSNLLFISMIILGVVSGFYGVYKAIMKR